MWLIPLKTCWPTSGGGNPLSSLIGLVDKFAGILGDLLLPLVFIMFVVGILATVALVKTHRGKEWMQATFYTILIPPVAVISLSLFVGVFTLINTTMPC